MVIIPILKVHVLFHSAGSTEWCIAIRLGIVVGSTRHRTRNQRQSYLGRFFRRYRQHYLDRNTPLVVTPFSVPLSACMAAVIAIMGFAGSMTMSAIKRDRGVKDYGTLVEGHVGILDRIDSICFAAPVFFHLVRFFYMAEWWFFWIHHREPLDSTTPD